MKDFHLDNYVPKNFKEEIFKMFKKLLLQYGLKAIGKGAAIVGGVLATKYGVDGETVNAITTGIAAGGGLVLNEAVDWYQKNRMVKKSESNTAKIEIVAKETNVAIPTKTIVLPPATRPMTPTHGGEAKQAEGKTAFQQQQERNDRK